MEAFTTLTSRTVVMPGANIDTDQIIPARFLTTTTRAGLGAQLFTDWRYDATGAPRPEFILNRPESQAARCWSRAAISAAAPRASTPPGHCSTMASAR